VNCSTPSETSTLDRVCRYFNVKNCETDSEDEDIKFDDEFLCHVCGQFDCVKFEFRGPGYKENFSQFRTNELAHKRSLVVNTLYYKTKQKNKNKLKKTCSTQINKEIAITIKFDVLFLRFDCSVAFYVMNLQMSCAIGGTFGWSGNQCKTTA
jgi:hypothetical protein